MRSFNALARVSVIDRYLAHQCVRETVCHHVFGPLTFAEAVLAHQHVFGTARLALIQSVAPA
jgi:hypothetical protein